MRSVGPWIKIVNEDEEVVAGSDDKEAVVSGKTCLPDLIFNNIDSDVVDLLENIVKLVSEEVITAKIVPVDNQTSGKICKRCDTLQIKLTNSKIAVTELSHIMAKTQQQNENLELESNVMSLKISLLNQKLEQQRERIMKNEAEIHRLEELQATSEYDIKKLENKLDEKENELS